MVRYRGFQGPQNKLLIILAAVGGVLLIALIAVLIFLNVGSKTKNVTSVTTPVEQTAIIQTAEPVSTATPDPNLQSGDEQLMAVVGWSMSDTRADGFHYRYMTDNDAVTLATGILTLAHQNKLGLDVTLSSTDAIGQVMLDTETLNSLLNSMISGLAMPSGGSFGTLINLGSGWALTPPENEVVLPHVKVISSADNKDIIVMTQTVQDGTTVLQTAEVELAATDGGFGHSIVSWTTYDMPEFVRKDGTGEVVLSYSMQLPTTALEILWGADCNNATVQVGGQQLTLDPAQMKSNRRMVVYFNQSVEVDNIRLVLDDPTAVKEIVAY